MPWRDIDGFDAQSLIDTLPYYVIVVDEDHTIWMANQAVRRTLNVNPEEIIGGYCPEVIHDCNGPVHQCPLEDAVKTGEDVEREIRDELTGLSVMSCIYDTGYKTPAGKRLFLHTTRPVPCRNEGRA